MYTKTSFVGLAICVYVCLFVASSESKELVAMDYIIKANMGKEKQMNVHKFDIRLPSFRSGAGEGEFDAAARDETRLWRGGVVPYVIHRSIRERPMYQANLEKAMKEWETYTCINFREKKKKDRDFVVFTYGTGCNADVGRKGKRQYVSLGKGCSDTSVIIHEIGHVVGFWHEQNRPDRNKYVEIIWKNIINEYKFAFSEYTNTRINSRNVTYDYESIMHYGNYAFSRNSKATIQAKNSAVIVFGNKHLSPLDIKQANLVYNCPVKESMFPQFPEDFVFSMNGTLPNKHCVLITEPRKVRRRPGWLCHNRTVRDAAIKWSHNGKIANMDCTPISSPFGEDRKGFWRDNYLCVANDSVYKFHWAKRQAIAGLGCLQWPIKTGQKNKTSFLCAKFASGPIDGGWSMWSPWTKCSRECGGGYQEQRRYCTNPEPKNYGKTCYGQDYRRQFCNRQKCSEYPTWPDDFWFRYYKYTPYEENCLRIYNRDAGLYWNNYYFCSLGHKRRINMKWSDMGSQPGMICTKVREPKEQDMWGNKYLCVPHNSQYRFQWSYSGPISGLQCVQWLAKNGTSGWDNNYLCAGKVTPKINDEDVAPLAVSAVVDGGWSSWTAWSRCSKTCDRGYQTRSRSCTEPTPSRDGKRCSGRGREMSSCTITHCPNPCIGTYTGDKGKLISPSFPNYPKNSKCHWKITVPQGKRVEMKFTYMRLKAQRSKCSSDSLVVRDGDNSKAAFLKRFCQNTMATQAIQSTGNTMFLELQTTSALHTGGFKAEWTSKDIPKKATCGGTLRGLNGTFTSPLYPAKYPDNTECTWSITVPLDRVLTVKFLSFYMESHKECSYDKLEIFDGGTISAPKKIYCGRKIPGGITAFTNRLLIKFKSDGTRNYDGFKISWVTKKRTFT